MRDESWGRGLNLILINLLIGRQSDFPASNGNVINSPFGKWLSKHHMCWSNTRNAPIRFHFFLFHKHNRPTAAFNLAWHKQVTLTERVFALNFKIASHTINNNFPHAFAGSPSITSAISYNHMCCAAGLRIQFCIVITTQSPIRRKTGHFELWIILWTNRIWWFQRPLRLDASPLVMNIVYIRLSHVRGYRVN